MVNRIDAFKGLENQSPLQSSAVPAGDRRNSEPLAPSAQPDSDAESLLTTPLIKRRPFLLQLFCNLPIGRKQALALIVCELIPILGFGVGTTLMLTSSLRTQIVEQAKSELR